MKTYLRWKVISQMYGFNIYTDDIIKNGKSLYVNILKLMALL